MKLCLILALCAAAAAAPSLEKEHQLSPAILNEVDLLLDQERSFVVNALVRQLIAYLRRIISNGSTLFGIPPLDPLELDHFHLNIPAQLINLDLDLKNIVVTGFSGFQVHTSNLDLSRLTFDLKISVPRIDIGAEEYDLIGDLYSAIPLFGKGKAKFHVSDFTFAAKLFLKQSEDKRSILIDRIENASFDIPALKSNLSGVIGGGDIDAIVNAITEDVIVNYLNRFQAVIASITSSTLVHFGNPLLDQLDTWRYIAPLLPRPRP